MIVDWDFFILTALPNISTIIISEWTKCSGGQAPKNTLREGVRLHLGITKFPSRDPVAKEIYDTLVKRRSSFKSISKKHPKWMSHTTLVQDIVNKHQLAVFDPISFNPYPIWMTTSKCGMTHYGTKMPTMVEVREQSYTFTSWEGHKFCKETLEVLSQLARKPNEKKPDDEGDDDPDDRDDDRDDEGHDPDDESDDEDWDEACNDMMQIFVKHPNGKTITLEVENTFTIKNIKAITMNSKYYLPTKLQRLHFMDMQLEDGYTLEDYNIQDQSILILLLGVKGGGKGAKPSTTDENKDHVVDNFIIETEKDLHDISVRVNDGHYTLIGQSTVGYVNESLASPTTYATRLFSSMTAEDLTKIIEVVYTNNKDRKMATTKGIVYTEGLKVIKNKKIAGDNLTSAMDDGVDWADTGVVSRQTQGLCPPPFSRDVSSEMVILGFRTQRSCLGRHRGRVSAETGPCLGRLRIRVSAVSTDTGVVSADWRLASATSSRTSSATTRVRFSGLT